MLHVLIDFSVNIWIVCLLVVFLLLYVLVCRGQWKSKKSFLGPTPWPFFGNILQLRNDPHLKLTKWSEIYGEIYQLRLGSWDAIVLNTAAAVRKTLLEQPSVFAGRPDFTSYKDIRNGKSLSFADYGITWRLHRKLANSALRCNGSCPITRLVLGEAELLANRLLQQSNSLSDPTPCITTAVASVIYNICFGRTSNLHENDEYLDMLQSPNAVVKTLGIGNVFDLMPWLTPLKIIFQGDLLKYIKKRAELNQQLRNDHLSTLNSVDSGSGDVMDVLLNTSKYPQSPKHVLAENQVIYTAEELTAAGFETVASTLTWAIAYMASYPEVQERAFNEINEALGYSQPTLTCRSMLPFVQACIYEVLRMAPAVPLALPHCTTTDTSVNGHSISKGSLVFVNLWAANRDKALWKQPETFLPERFLDGSGQLDSAQVNKSLSFCAGPRRCLGEFLAKQELFLFLVILLQRCEFKESLNKRINFKSEPGLVLKPTSLNVIVNHRKTMSVI